MLKKLFAILIFLSVVMSLTSCGEEKGGDGQIDEERDAVDTSQIAEKFEGDLNLEVEAMVNFYMGKYLRINFVNGETKSVEAIELFVEQYDVYNELICLDKISFNTSIQVDGTASTPWDTDYFLSKEVKKVKVYIYSVYYEDGTFWGDKDATRDNITRYGKEYEIKVGE